MKAQITRSQLVKLMTKLDACPESHAVVKNLKARSLQKIWDSFPADMQYWIVGRLGMFPEAMKALEGTLERLRNEVPAALDDPLLETVAHNVCLRGFQPPRTSDYPNWCTWSMRRVCGIYAETIDGNIPGKGDYDGSADSKRDDFAVHISLVIGELWWISDSKNDGDDTDKVQAIRADRKTFTKKVASEVLSQHVTADTVLAQARSMFPEVFNG